MRTRTILVYLVLVVAFASGQALMGQKFDTITFLTSADTAAQNAVCAVFLSSLDGGASASTAISVSNVLAPPPNNEAGTLSIVLKNRNGETIVFNSAEHPNVGRGFDSHGKLQPGHTWTALLNEIIGAALGQKRDFIGYAWFLPEFGVIKGTYTNFFPLLGGSQQFQLLPAPTLAAAGQFLGDGDEWGPVGDPGQDDVLQCDEDEPVNFYFNFTADPVKVSFTIHNNGQCEVIMKDVRGRDEIQVAAFGPSRPLRAIVPLRGAKQPTAASLVVECKDDTSGKCDYKITNVRP